MTQSTPIRKFLSHRIIRFGIVGVAATLSYFLLGLLFVTLLRLPVLVGNALAYALSFAVSYWGQSRWTFSARQAHGEMMPKYAATQFLGLLLNSAIIELLMRMVLPYELAMVVATGIVPLVVFILCKYWVFRTREN